MSDRRVHIVVDGIVYGFQKFGGINTYFNEILPRVARRNKTSVSLLVPKSCAGNLPKAPVWRLPREALPTRTGISWRLDQAIAPMIERSNAALRTWRAFVRKACVFHSTYFTWVGDCVPQVASAHDMNHELFPELYRGKFGMWLRRQYREYIQRATRIIAVSNKTKRDVVKFYGIDPSVIKVVYHAVDRNQFWPEQGAEARERLKRQWGIHCPYVLYVGGREHAYKNFSGLIEAFAHLSAKKSLSLVVAGKPPKETETARLSQLGIASVVHFVTHPSIGELRTLYSNASAFVFPSRHEGFGIPLLEAMACGTPVVASDTEVFREVAGDAAIWFDPFDVQDLIRAIEHALDKGVRERMVQLGTQRVAKYSWDMAAERTHAVYLEAVRTRFG